ncbi:MAG: PsbP-related protein [Pseudonocardiaceae bacterium]
MNNLWNALRRRRVLVIIGLLLAVGLGTSAAIFGPRLFTGIQPGQATKTANTANATNKADSSAKSTPAGFSEFRSEQAGFELAYPSDWTKLSAKDPQVLLLLSQGPQDSMLVRVSELQEAIGPQQLPAMKQVTDKLVASNKTVQMVAGPNQIELGGLPGYYYFYNFTDPATGQQGSHSHFFLFNGKTMISMVFQSLPKEHFAESAKTFDQVANSLHALKK